jgi:hypothetical protein
MRAKWFPSVSDLEWCEAFVKRMKHGDRWGTWSGELYRVDHVHKRLVWIGGKQTELHARNKVAFGLIGYEVTD